MLLDNGKRILIRQVAGVMARRIVCYAKEGERVKQNQELGFIRFGSRVDLFLPLDFPIDVDLQDKVKNAIKELNKTWTEKRDQLHEDKLKEIEDAHNKYLQEQAEAAQKQKEEQLAAGDGGKSLDLSQLQG